jgi:hypothetical protein
MKWTYFSCENTPCDRNLTWSEEQMLMYIRLRRLIAEHNDYVLEEKHQERELELLKECELPSLFTEPMAFTIHEKYAGRSFQYGTINKTLFNLIFREKGKTDQPNEEFLNMALDIDIEVQCSPELAPYEYAKRIDMRSLELCSNGTAAAEVQHTTGTDNEEEFVLKMTISGPTSFKKTSPSKFEWMIKSNDFDIKTTMK